MIHQRFCSFDTSSFRLCLWTALFALLSAGSLWAQDFVGFEPSGDFAVELDGEELAGAELFHSERSSAYLIMAPSLKSPLLINPRSRTVEAVSFMKVSKKENGTIDLLQGAAYESLGPFQMRHQALLFDVKGQKMVLKQKPELVGNQSAAALAEYNPSYAWKSNKYITDDAKLGSLKGEKRDVKVKIYFGTWCPVCSRLVPKVMKVAESLEGSKIDFEYYGLPKMMTDDPVAEELEIRGVPTGIIYVDGKEIGRLTGRELQKPEAAIQKVLSGA